MYRSVSIFVILFSALTFCHAQSAFSLQECIDSALAYNIPVRQKFLQSQSADVDWHQSRSNLLPNLNSNIYHGISQGKSIDPNSNSYVTQSLNYANYQIGSLITVFNGGALMNNVKQYATAYEASKMEWQQAKDNLVLNVILAYLQVLNNEDLVTSAIKQADVSQKTLERAEVLNNQGAIKPSDLSDFRGQLMNDQLAIVNNKNAMESSKLILAQYMNRPYDIEMKLQRLDMEEFLAPYTNTPGQVYINALQQFSLVKAVELRKKSYEYAARSARSSMLPGVVIDGGFNTRYSSFAQTPSGKVPYNTQLGNNLASFFEVGLNIPIFNRSLLRNRVKQADIALRNEMLIEEDTKMQLHHSIDQAWLNMNNAYEKYKLLLQQVNAYSESFKAAETRFNAGVGNSLDYLTAKDKLDRANINLISTKYDFVLRKKILDYYNSSIYVSK